MVIVPKEKERLKKQLLQITSLVFILKWSFLSPSYKRGIHFAIQILTGWQVSLSYFGIGKETKITIKSWLYQNVLKATLNILALGVIAGVLDIIRYSILFHSQAYFIIQSGYTEIFINTIYFYLPSFNS